MDTSLTIPILETEKHVPQGEEDACLLAMSYFHLKEYDRAAWTLREFNGEKALFIKSYSKYLVRLHIDTACLKVWIYDLLYKHLTVWRKAESRTRTGP